MPKFGSYILYLLLLTVRYSTFGLKDWVNGWLLMVKVQVT